MLKYILLTITLLLSSTVFASQAPYSGELTVTALIKEYPKFNDEYLSYAPSENELKLIQKLAGKEVLVLFGTWCHDSQREVPRFLKLLDKANVELAKLSLIAVGYDKRDPDGIASEHNLRYTPTIIVFENGQELSRMIERPKQSLAVDLSQF
ncbi:thioredoxin family protein [Pseudoalteromonas shioyasakiensis]|uniref:thioredoxin family protein n=1 Tax=Pseudoalteromonas shioyasakiensis TaxID=1190813 RepID=UPI002119878C|nr:thioredoxin family protein [Pseudoalteromonas shioyasakiensis]MCQ8878784.1 thioredoxin family protein [Pseudoalteromonas shioyasakiensis]